MSIYNSCRTMKLTVCWRSIMHGSSSCHYVHSCKTEAARPKAGHAGAVGN